MNNTKIEAMKARVAKMPKAAKRTGGDLLYPDTYRYLQSSVCHYAVCKHKANCGKCPYGTIRTYAARDNDRWHRDMAEIDALKAKLRKARARIRALEKAAVPTDAREAAERKVARVFARKGVGQ